MKDSQEQLMVKQDQMDERLRRVSLASLRVLCFSPCLTPGLKSSRYLLVCTPTLPTP